MEQGKGGSPVRVSEDKLRGAFIPRSREPQMLPSKNIFNKYKLPIYETAFEAYEINFEKKDTYGDWIVPYLTPTLVFQMNDPAKYLNYMANWKFYVRVVTSYYDYPACVSNGDNCLVGGKAIINAIYMRYGSCKWIKEDCD